MSTSNSNDHRPQQSYVEDGHNETTTTSILSASEKETAAPKPPPLSIPALDKSHVPQRSASQIREQQHRWNDELELQRAERVASRASHTSKVDSTPARMKSQRNIPTRQLEEPEDEFDVSINPVHQPSGGVWTPPTKPKTKLAHFVKRIHGSSVLVRYFTYIVPVALILLIPILLAALVFQDNHVGGVKLLWFCVWLMVVWLSLWAGRIMAKSLPVIVGIIASVVSNSSKKWKDMARMLEIPCTLFLWWLAVFISFVPTMTNHHIDGNKSVKYWENRMQLVLIAIFVGMVLNFFEKIIIQLIAISFHQRTYEDRIVLNKFQIASLAKLYNYSRQNLTHYEDESVVNSADGSRTPFGVMRRAGAGAQTALTMVGDAFGKVAGDFTGTKKSSSGAPQRVVVTLLQTTEGCQALARRLYRTFIKPENDNITAQDLRTGFTNDDESDAAFQMFDRDLNGDISCEEMELSIVEIGRERKAITASLKDLDSVISKLDNVLTSIVVIITIIVFLSIISTSTASLISSASGTVLALSWLFSGTAQEFLASIIFVFVKHPFDVGDRIDILNTSAGVGGSFYVKEIALMYTEFRKVQGQVVQAPNSLLNTCFILNMRRSGALAEPVSIYIKFGTTIEQIDELRVRMLEFVKGENREFQGKILTELIDIPDMHSIKLNVVFFYKSNWQNELLRLARRNKFMCALMLNINAVGIESPNMRWPGQRPTAPMFLSTLPPAPSFQGPMDAQLPPAPGLNNVTTADWGNRPMGPDPYITPYYGMGQSQSQSPETRAYQEGRGVSLQDGEIQSQAQQSSQPNMQRTPSIIRQPPSSTSLNQFTSTSPSKKFDYSLGLRSEFLLDDSADVFEDRRRHNNPGMLSPQALDRVKEEVEDDIQSVAHPPPNMPHHTQSVGGHSTGTNLFSGGFLGSRRRRRASTSGSAASVGVASVGSHSMGSHSMGSHYRGAVRSVESLEGGGGGREHREMTQRGRVGDEVAEDVEMGRRAPGSPAPAGHLHELAMHLPHHTNTFPHVALLHHGHHNMPPLPPPPPPPPPPPRAQPLHTYPQSSASPQPPLGGVGVQNADGAGHGSGGTSAASTMEGKGSRDELLPHPHVYKPDSISASRAGTAIRDVAG